ncbi:MAG: beta-galactosidase, partial [Bacteroidia bacterium]
MKNYFFFLLFLAACTSNNQFTRETLSLAGEWGFAIDSLDQGVAHEWYNTTLADTVRLPGSMAENGKGNEVGLNTDWTGDIVDRSYFTDSKYEKYRQPGNIKIPFWLKPVKYYKGAAWYQKDVEIPESWTGKEIVLLLERCHWESTVFVNGKKAGYQNSLSTTHEFNIADLLVPGTNRITVRIDNSVIIPIGVNSHSISDHTQSNWNGITGAISLTAISKVFIDEVRIFPDLEKKIAKVIVSVKNPGNADFKGKLTLQAQVFNSLKERKLPGKNVTIVTKSGEQQIIVNYKISDPQLWSEFTPALYRMSADLKEKGKIIDSRSVDFGMREFKTKGTRFAVNGRPVFLRGTTECCIFPLTGYPPTDTESWEKVLQTCRDYGLNHVRFHSFCPPEAAFVAADKLGIYFHVECSSWANQGTSIGNGGPVDRFIYEEGDRIIREYGNHPSFCMLAYGNEPAGSNQNKFLGELITYWRAKDNRRVYTSAAGWPIIPENDYNLTSEPRIQHWGEGLKSIINSEPPQTMFDFRDYVSKYEVPTVGHEIGQWCVYPDFKEIEQYTGVLKPSNFEIFRETLAENNMAGQAEDFLMASGKLQALCYKADIEAALRTPGFAGFQMLQLHDFPGQGTALVGILNPFFRSKGYINPEEFRMFCSETVPLARMEKMVYKTDEVFKTTIEISNFGPGPLYGSSILCRLINSDGETINQQVFVTDTIEIGNCIPVGTYSFDPAGILKAQKLTLEVSVQNTSYKNKWDIWIYPSQNEIDKGNILITDKLDKTSEET